MGAVRGNTTNELIEGVNFGDMFIPIDYDRLLTQDSPNAHAEFAIAVTQGFYRTFINNILEITRKEVPDATVDDIPDYMKKRSFLYSKVATLQALDQYLPDLLNRSMGFLLAEAERTSWFRAAEDREFFTWDKLTDMLNAIMDDQHGGGLGAWKVVVQEILPACKKAGHEPLELLAASTQSRKMRELVPAWHELQDRMKSGVVRPEEGERDLRWMVNLAASPRVSSSQMKEQVNKWRGREIARPKALEGYKMQVLGGKVWLVVPVENEVQLRMVENALVNRVEFKMQGMDWLIRSVARMLKSVRIERMAHERDNTDSPGHEREVVSGTPGHDDQGHRDNGGGNSRHRKFRSSGGSGGDSRPDTQGTNPDADGRSSGYGTGVVGGV